jgi:hypothetical protein
MRNLSVLLCGMIFGLGLAISGMIDPSKVIGFLDITGNWDPSLAFVMGAAVCVTAICFRLVLRRPAPVLGGVFQVPTKRDLDAPLIVGAALFGVGWGLAGLCPGPAFSSLAFFGPKILVFVLAMLAGAMLAKQTIFNPFAGAEPETKKE